MATVKYWLRLSDTELEPFATSKTGMLLEIQYRNQKGKNLAWCKECKAVVEFESKLDAAGLYNVCPFCGIVV